MKLTNWLVEKVGSDKLLHFCVGAWIVCECDSSINMMMIAIAFVLAISIIKELIDDSPELMDIVYAMFGCALSFIIGVLKLMV